MWDRRYIVFIALGMALAGTYRRAAGDNVEDLDGWLAFLTIWAPAAVLLGLGVVYAWPAVANWWNRR